VNQPLGYLQLYVGQGWVGVDLFFVLSGFLITGILMETREAGNYFSGFYGRRILRIFPLYYLVLVGLIVLGVVLTRYQMPGAAEVVRNLPLPRDRWVYLCFLTNWTGLWAAKWDSHFASIVAHFWSLGVEEQFYFFWPLLLWLVRPRAVPWVAIGLTITSAAIRLFWALHVGVQALVPPASITIALATVCRLDSLFIGALCAWLYRQPEWMKKLQTWLPWVAVICLGSYFAFFTWLIALPETACRLIYGVDGATVHHVDDAMHLFTECGGFTLLAIGFGALVLFAAHSESRGGGTQKLLQSRALAPIGRYSYGIYVYHVPIIGLGAIYILPRLTAQSTAEAEFSYVAYMVVIAAISFLVAALSYELFEKRLLRLKRFFVARYASLVPSTDANTGD
jgi:peptidoglycan/LPS O-acetylase OafA/YrhL